MLWKIIKRISKILGKNFPSNYFRCLFFRLAGYKIGKDVYIGEDLIVIDELDDKGLVKIGDRAAIAERVTLVVSSFPNNSNIRPFIREQHGPVTIAEDAWLGTGSIILPNVRIGKGAVVGAGSVVTKNVPDYTIVIGVPAHAYKNIIIDCRNINTMHLSQMIQ